MWNVECEKCGARVAVRVPGRKPDAITFVLPGTGDGGV
jgi:hypothetical protein